MKYLLFICCTFLLLQCTVSNSSTINNNQQVTSANNFTCYIVRHAEKESVGGTDPVLTEQGKKRAESLRMKLADKEIREIYSTNTIRTRSTAEPLSKALNVPITTYAPMPDANFLAQIKQAKKNLLIVGHSNTVDDIVNGLANEVHLKDLPDNEYDNLFIVRFQGEKAFFEQVKF